MKYLYQRNNGIITKYEKLTNNEYIDIKTGIITNSDNFLYLGKVSEDITDLIEESDIVETVFDGIVEVFKGKDNKIYYDLPEHQPSTKYLTVNNIKSILTKEEFNKRKFEV